MNDLALTLLRHGTLTLFGAPFQADFGRQSGLWSTVLVKTTIRKGPLNPPIFQFGHIPFRSPLLRESLLVSFPPLNDMLKFSG